MTDTDRIAKDIARRQMLELDFLAEYLNLPTRFSGLDRKTVAHCLRLGARDVIEREANREQV